MRFRFLLTILACSVSVGSVAAQAKFLSHPPIRNLPPTAKREFDKAPLFFVDAAKGDDKNEGSEKSPWRTINHALKQLKPGDTLCLRGGLYHENVYCAVSGRKDAPITIRSFPGEQAIIDGGMPVFQTEPAKAWEPYPKGGVDEYRSTQPYKNIRDVVGRFGDSNVGLQTYWHAKDLRAKNELWIDDPKEMVQPVYCGPGLWYDRETGHIHVRLAHTHLETPKLANYRGEIDPRKLPLVVAPFNSVPLFVDMARHVRFQDLMIRGGGHNCVVLQTGIDLEFDNVTIFAGTYGVRSRGTGPLKMIHSAIHGMLPPWAFRDENSLFTYNPRSYDPFLPPVKPASERNVARLPTHALLVTEGSYEFEVFHYPYNHDWEISYSEFTDGHDGVYLSGREIRFHHNFVDGIQDDAIYLSSPSPNFNDNIHVYQNLIASCLMAFSCNSLGGPDGTISIYRNIVDMRRGANVSRPSPKNPQGRQTTYHIFLTHGREMLGIESLRFYQNTFVSHAYNGSFVHRTWANTTPRTSRRVFNNLCVYLKNYPDMVILGAPEHDIAIDGNLHWCFDKSAKFPEGLLDKVRACPASKKNLKNYPPGWCANDFLADPRFLKFADEAESAADFRLQKDSPARGKGVALPTDWADPLRSAAGQRPDIGALPVGADAPAFGRNGRIATHRPG